MVNEQKKNSLWNIILTGTAVFACVALIMLAFTVISSKPEEPEPTEPPAPTEPQQFEIMDAFDSLVTGKIADAHEAALGVKKVYWIPESADIAPAPNPACYGQTDDPASLQWLLDEAATLLDGQDTLFSTDVEILDGSTITYYFDESILVITWLEVRDNYVYTFSEVKVSHPSQFRRYLANNEYNSDYIHPVSRMATAANAVMASSADYYRGRNHGIIVYQGEVKRTDHCELVDTCFIDDQGDLILVPAGELKGMEDAQAFVDEHNIDFSLAFGPILVENGERCEPQNYYLGEVNDKYPRAGLCQRDKLHYVVVVANNKWGYIKSPTIHGFAEQIATLGCQRAYALDGGQTGTISMQGKALNPRQTSERWITDIILFATAIPSQEETPEPTEP